MSTEEATGRDELIIPGLESVLGLQLPPALAFEHPGVTHTLTVTDAQPVRDRDFDSGELLSWPSGDAKMVLVLIGVEENGAPASYWVRGRRANDARRAASSSMACGVTRPHRTASRCGRSSSTTPRPPSVRTCWPASGANPDMDSSTDLIPCRPAASRASATTCSDVVGATNQVTSITWATPSNTTATAGLDVNLARVRLASAPAARRRATSRPASRSVRSRSASPSSWSCP